MIELNGYVDALKIVGEKAKSSLQEKGIVVTENIYKEGIDSIKEYESIKTKKEKLSEQNIGTYIGQGLKGMSVYELVFTDILGKDFNRYIEKYAHENDYVLVNVEKLVANGEIIQRYLYYTTLELRYNCKTLVFDDIKLIAPSYEIVRGLFGSKKAELEKLKKDGLMYGSRLSGLRGEVSKYYNKVSYPNKEFEGIVLTNAKVYTKPKAQKVHRVTDDYKLREKTVTRLKELYKRGYKNGMKEGKNLHYVEGYGIGVKTTTVPIVVTTKGIVRSDIGVVLDKRLSTEKLGEYLQRVFKKNSYGLRKDEINYLCNLLITADNHRINIDYI